MKDSETQATNPEGSGRATPAPLRTLPRGRYNLWQRLVEPAVEIRTPSELRQARLVSAMLLTLAITMVTGVIYMATAESNQGVALVLGGADIGIWLAYLLSRTRYYRQAALITLSTLVLIPILNGALGEDHSSEALLILFIWNSLTVLISSAIASNRQTMLFAGLNILTLGLMPVFVPSIAFPAIALPLIFNTVISILILVFTQHRNLLERDRQQELVRLNRQLQSELNERQRVEAELSYTAMHDTLTDLPNRALFMDRLIHAMERAKRHKEYTFAVIFLDLDRFKVVNDSLGHNIGDLLLVECAKRLSACVRNEDTLARLGGDEFVILLECIDDPSEFYSVADRIQKALVVPSDLEGHRVFISVSMGIVLSTEHYKRPEDILRDADLAMYRAKGRGRGRYEVFYAELLTQAITRLDLESDLRKSLDHREFILHYQPIMVLESQQIIGFEALLRWQHPERGLILPEDFIQMAEDNGLIVPIGNWVLEEACRQIRAWQVQYPTNPPLSMSVNLSALQFAQYDLVARVQAVLEANQLDASSLKLELTESMIVEDSETTADTLAQLRTLGVEVQIDDFGTGYSILGYLHALPINTLKIDRTFVGRLNASNGGVEVVRTILELAHELGIKVVAEGVETDEQLSQLMAMNCEFGQGFLFNHPLESLQAEALLSKTAETSRGRVPPQSAVGR